MIRAHLIRLNPTPQQAEYFRKACGTARFVFNPVCGQKVERDLNAALNIRDEAVRLTSVSPVVATSGTEKIACGRRVRPAMAGGGG